MTYFLHRRRGETLAETMIENRREPAITTSLWWFTLVYSQRLSVVCGDLLWCIHSDSVLRVVIYFGVFTAIESCVVIYFGVFTAIQWCVVIYSGVFTAIQCCVWWFTLVYSQRFSAVCGDLLWCIHSDWVLCGDLLWCIHSDSVLCVVIYFGVFTAIQCCVWWFTLVYSQRLSAVIIEKRDCLV